MGLNFDVTELVPIGKVDIPDVFYNRYLSGIEEFDYLLGGGALPGSVITLCAKGGLGKSTLLMQVFQKYAERDYNVAYLSGEESAYQIAFRCDNLGVYDVPVANITDLDTILQLIRSKELNMLVIDSFQHLTTEKEIQGRAFQRYAIDEIVKTAQDTQCTVFIIMHVTKAGILKGDSYVPHTADVNIEIRSGEKDYGDRSYRIIEIPTKNRFGQTTEIVTQMTSTGFIFTVDVEPIEQSKTNKRSQAKQNEFEQILNMVEPPAITPERVMEELGVDYAHAYGRLAELTKNKKLIKYGRGQHAIFKVAELQESYEEVSV